MQIEPFDEDDGYRCWLSRSEQELLVDHYEEEPRKQVAIELMLDGLRSDEAAIIAREHFRRLDSEEEAWKVRVPEGKTGWREAPVSRETKRTAFVVANSRRLGQSDPIVDVGKRQVQRYVENARDPLQEATGDEDWQWVSAHDLRRTWATHTYYAIGATPMAKEVIMNWGGWEDEATFRRNYLGREPDYLAAELMEQADLR